MNNVEALRTTVDQLRAERAIKREKTSKTIEELKHFIQSHQYADKLVTGFASNTNPYKVKGFSCELI
jgi:hypothetical protein